MKKLYLSQWDYNSYLIMEELKKIVIANGGYCVSNWEKKQEKTKIYNRSIKNKIESKQKHIEYLETIKENMTDAEKENINKNIDNYLQDIIKLEKQYKKASRIVTNNNYLQFIINNPELKDAITTDIYYIQFNDNPFFEFYYSKQVIGNNLTLDYNCYLDKLPKEKLFIKDYYNKYGKATIKKTADNIFKYIVNAHYSKRYGTKIIFKQFHKIEG